MKKTRSRCQQGWVEQRKRKRGSVWLIRYRVRDAATKSGWRTQTETLENAKNETEAKVELQKRMTAVNRQNRRGPQPAALTFADFEAGLWTDYLVDNSVKPSTRYSYDSMLRNYARDEIGQLPLESITPATITALLSRLRGKSAQYRLNFYALLRTMFEVALEYDLIEGSPVRKKLHRPKVEPKEKPSLSVEELRDVLQKIPAAFQVLFFCLAVTGLRIGELLGLRWANVDWQEGWLAVTNSLWRGTLGTPKTADSAAPLHLPLSLRELLFEHFGRAPFREPNDFVFCRADGSPYDPGFLRKKVLYPAMDAAGIERAPRTHGFHLFRHSAGSIVHGETKDLKLTQELLRHSRMSTTADIYLHTEEQGARQATEALATALVPYCSLIAHSSDSKKELVQ